MVMLMFNSTQFVSVPNKYLYLFWLLETVFQLKACSVQLATHCFIIIIPLVNLPVLMNRYVNIVEKHKTLQFLYLWSYTNL